MTRKHPGSSVSSYARTPAHYFCLHQRPRSATSGSTASTESCTYRSSIQTSCPWVWWRGRSWIRTYTSSSWPQKGTTFQDQVPRKISNSRTTCTKLWRTRRRRNMIEKSSIRWKIRIRIEVLRTKLHHGLPLLPSHHPIDRRQAVKMRQTLKLPLQPPINPKNLERRPK